MNDEVNPDEPANLETATTTTDDRLMSPGPDGMEKI